MDDKTPGHFKIEDLHKAKANAAIDDIIKMYGQPGAQSQSGEHASMTAGEMKEMLEIQPQEIRRAVMHYEGIDSDLKWDSSLDITDLVNSQHMRVMESINKLQKACSDERATQESDGLLNTLSEVLPVHFEEEHRLMTETRYPKFNEHRVTHWQFLTTLERLQKLYKLEGKTKDFMIELYSQSVRWFIKHVKVEDAEFAAFYRKYMARFDR